MALETYRKKRKFGITPEPRGRTHREAGRRYVIQKHAARRLHYDLRLELDGVMKSWAVTRGPSLDPAEKRLAVEVEDHPVEYNSFEGAIPRGEYGGGTVMIWDRGTWAPEGDPHKGLAKGHLMFDLHGEKLHGRWQLVRMRPRKGDRHNNWLLIKGKDDDSRETGAEDILQEEPLSVASGRSMEEIAAGEGGKKVWRSNRADPPRQNAVKASSAKRGQRSAQKRSAPASAKATRKIKNRSNKKFAGTARKRKAKKKPSADPELPDFVPPSLATLRDAAPSGTDWLHEIKFDGYRIEARLNHGRVQLLTRNRQDWTDRYLPIAAAVARLPATTALLDGELVVEDEAGISSFSLLQSDQKEGRTDRLVYYVFDLLHLDGRDLTGEPLSERKAALAQLLRGLSKNGRIRYTEHFDEDGPIVFKHACQMKLEGIISKRRDAPYRAGRSDNFVKCKCFDRQEFVVAGFTASTAEAKAVGALIAAYYDHGELRYAGRIGTGYTHQTARELWKRLERMRIAQPPVLLPPDERRKNVIWVKPDLVIEAEFRGFTQDGLLRQASYKGLREDKPARDVVREMPTTMAAAAKEGAAAPTGPLSKTAKRASARASAGDRKSGEAGNVRLTHPDRVYWPDAGVTKQDLAEYYESVWDWMAPHVVGRPLALVRCPSGTAGDCFFQKHIAATIRHSPLRHAVKAKEHDVIAVESLDDVLALVQTAALEIHVRGSHLDELERCDRIVFDLDPGEGVAWKAIVAAAQEVRERLAALKLDSFAKLSGGKGIHVVLPVEGVDWERAESFAQAIARAVGADSPGRYVGKMTKALRAGRIFIDYFRNTREATSVAAYSTRARPGAPVSVPLTWEELAGTSAANEFTVLNLKKRVRRDAWADIGKVRQKLPS